MKPVEFKQQNSVFAKDQKEYLPLPAFVSGDHWGAVTSCWALTWRERLRVLWTGRVFVTSMTFDQPLQPLKVATRFEESK